MELNYIETIDKTLNTKLTLITAHRIITHKWCGQWLQISQRNGKKISATEHDELSMFSFDSVVIVLLGPLTTILDEHTFNGVSSLGVDKE